MVFAIANWVLDGETDEDGDGRERGEVNLVGQAGVHLRRSLCTGQLMALAAEEHVLPFPVSPQARDQSPIECGVAGAGVLSSGPAPRARRPAQALALSLHIALLSRGNAERHNHRGDAAGSSQIEPSQSLILRVFDSVFTPTDPINGQNES